MMDDTAFLLKIYYEKRYKNMKNCWSYSSFYLLLAYERGG